MKCQNVIHIHETHMSIMYIQKHSFEKQFIFLLP